MNQKHTYFFSSDWQKIRILVSRRILVINIFCAMGWKRLKIAALPVSSENQKLLLFWVRLWQNLFGSETCPGWWVTFQS